MARAEMSITPAELTVLIDDAGPTGAISCMRTLEKDDAEYVREQKLLPFLTAVAERTGRVTPLCLSKVIAGSTAATQAEKASMVATLWMTWRQLCIKKKQQKSGARTSPAHKRFFSTLQGQ
eukprot:1080456-Amphidinium_carterae.1